jgi:hypothetical protein
MRILIFALSVLEILVSVDAAKAAPSTTIRNLSASVDPATFTDEATQETQVLVLVAKIRLQRSRSAPRFRWAARGPLRPRAAAGNRRIAVLTGAAESDPAQQARVAAFGKSFGNRGVLAVRRVREAFVWSARARS